MPLKEGDIVHLIDRKGKKYQIMLKKGESFFFHRGSVSHDDIIGLEEGSIVKSTKGEALIVWRPTLSDFILKMRRGAQVIYPKDIGAILMLADIFPGARVLEAGTGSGALTLALLRAVGEKGIVFSYERTAAISLRLRSRTFKLFSSMRRREAKWASEDSSYGSKTYMRASQSGILTASFLTCRRLGVRSRM